ncbi:vesicle-associated protein 2-1-like isoform X2 [Hibiscus syriacus]|uniref:vesicle-associated protein 2-1-like isoform X2 n=1 Tax=Hibiscus syriacus TaxID=106335 RepID=UPI001921E505|nr:vesicle-associated protein 2-1-like isoform X2 [Hibiscus syriacus]
MSADGNNQLITVQPNGLKFVFELEKPSVCDLKVVNNTEHHVAFKVKTTSPKKYFVRPNTGVVQPLDSSVIRVTLQAQREYPPDMQCKDKFLLQSTVVPSNTDVDDLPADAFNKDSTREIQECKLKVFYVTPSSRGNSEDEEFKSYPEQGADSNSTVQHLKDERDAAVRQTLQLQQELDFLKRRRQRRNDSGFPLIFAFVVGVIGILCGFLLNLSLSSSPLPPSSPLVDSSTPFPAPVPPHVDSSTPAASTSVDSPTEGR